MLDNPDEIGIYGTTKAFDEIENYIQSVRVEAIGWAIADACVAIDRRKDYRKIEIPSIIERAKHDLE